MLIKFRYAALFIFFLSLLSHSQNLVVDGAISSSNVNWGGGTQEAPWNASTFENSYLTGACNSNYVMEVDAASSPSQALSGFIASTQYIITFRCAFRNSGCTPSATPTIVQFQFTDSPGTLTYTFSIPSIQNILTAVQYTFTNNASTTHTLRITNPGNVNTCGAIIDDISITKLASPGGVSTSTCSLWLNAGSIGISDNFNVFAWISQGSNSIPFVAPCAAPPLYKTGIATNANVLVANHNPYITFNGTTQYLDYITQRIDLYDNAEISEGGSFFAVYQGGSNNRTYFGSRCANDSRTWARTNRYMFPNAAITGTNNQASYTQSARVNLITMCGASNGLTLSDQNGSNIGLASNAGNIDYLTVGVRRNLAGTYSEYHDGSISELIIFKSTLTNTDAQKVRSYLAAKYGVTLSDNTSTAGLDERNYISTNATNYWTYSANSLYHNNLTVIGRDNNTALNQRRSISTDSDPTGVAGGNAMLILDNVSSISADNSFLAAGHDNVAGNTQELYDIPAGIQVRMRRIWKFQKTGTGIANSVNAIFDLTGYAPITGGNLRLLVSNSPSFAGATIIAGAYAATYFTASLPTTGGVYFTVASTNSVNTPLPVELISFEAKAQTKQVELNWTTSTERNNKLFEIERSENGIDFKNINIVNSKANQGIRYTPINYNAYDEDPIDGVSYYRLKQIDYDESYTYSQLVSVNYSKAKNIQFTVFPNPNKGEFIADVSGIENNHNIVIELHDVRGRLVYSNNFFIQDLNGSRFNIKPENRLESGIYTCSLKIQEIVFNVNVIIN